MAVMKTPGVYVVEKNAFPNSVVEAATAVPAFIGYTEKAEKDNKSLKNKPTRITSMSEYRTFFGEAPAPKFDVAEGAAGYHKISAYKKNYSIARTDKFSFYYNMLLFFSNGGGACYIVSVGNYSDEGIKKEDLLNGIKPLEKEQEPTMVVIPELVNLEKASECYEVQQEMLSHCGYKMQNRFAVLDVFEGYKEGKETINNFREGIGSNFLSYGAAYYPWLNTTIISESDLNFSNINKFNDFAPLLKESLLEEIPKMVENIDGVEEDKNKIKRGEIEKYIAVLLKNNGVENISDGAISKDDLRRLLEGMLNNSSEEELKKLPGEELQKLLRVTVESSDSALKDIPDNILNVLAEEILKDPAEEGIDNLTERIFKEIGSGGDTESKEVEKENSMAHKVLFKMSALYRETIKEMTRILNRLPVSAAMAGIYTMVDNTKGVWKAPANVSIAAVESSTVSICHDEQEDLNVPVNGKAINAIRFFTGEGIKVWGARTLDGNSLDWRYINVRRTMIMLEESIKNAAKAYVFDPNDANTWVNMKSMIGNFLNGIWKRGGLAGSTPDDAYSVHVGLGETMTPEDILEGILRVTVLVAITRPTEFIEITFQQQMQKS